MSVVAVAFVVIPQSLESYRIHPFLLGSAGLLLGTLVGRGGVSGLVLDQARAWRRKRAEASAPADVRSLAEQAAGARRAGRERVHDRALAVVEGWFGERRSAVADMLEVRGVSVAFGGVQALRDVSLAVPSGQLGGLIGSNGAGKTTLFDVVSGLRTPDAGSVLLAGRDISATRPWARAALGVSRTFQASRVDLDLTVAENLLSGAYPMIPGNLAASVLGLTAARNGMRRAEAAAWALAELLDVDHHWDEPCGRLSFGNRRGVEIGRTLMSGPRLLLLDEPSAGLDPTAARQLFSLVRRLHGDLGLTALLVEHDVRAVLEHCSLVHVLSQGQLVATGRPDEVVSHPDVRQHYLGANFDSAARIRSHGPRV